MSSVLFASGWIERAFLGSLAIGMALWFAAPHRTIATPTPLPNTTESKPAPEPPTIRIRPLVRGDAFPDGILALTWDDGPDAETLPLARYLHDEHVSATFFVVGEWIDGLSMDPGIGTNVYGTGYRRMPLLADLVGLGHRLGGHTENHVVLGKAALPMETAFGQIFGSQHATDPFLTNELRMFRAPGGAWGEHGSRVLEDPRLADVVGPVHWDIDRHDWDGALYCREAPPADCETGPAGPRVRPEAMARRYLAEIEETRRGIVLLHDRVGHVGSRWALDLARSLVPALAARGYVFAAPVLGFGPLRPRLDNGGEAGDALLADIDGDGRADLCEREGVWLTCTVASSEREGPSDVARVRFGSMRPFGRLFDDVRAFGVADVRGGRAADLCQLRKTSIDCQRGPTGPSERWITLGEEAIVPMIALGDIDGDGRSDVCLRNERSVVCATSTGSSFSEVKAWAKTVDGALLADVDGDGRADLCHRTADGSGIDCALSDGKVFGRETRWSNGELTGLGPLTFADLNGDGRADVCSATSTGVSCALSNGHAFKRASAWSASKSTALRLGDISGDGRADLCAFEAGYVACGLAP